MDPLTTAAASGLQSRLDAMDILANNLANTSTAGFKADREFYSTYMAPELADGSSPTVGEAPLVQRQWTDFSQGTLSDTGSPTDFALSGKGFFAVTGPNGPLYTRSGSFHMAANGTLVTKEGYPLRLSTGKSLQTQPNLPLQVQPTGQVTQDGNELGQLELVDFKSASELRKMGGAYFQSPGPEAGGEPATGAQVLQGKIEGSNASPAESAVRMVTLLRHFEMLQHAVKLSADMNKQAVEEVARVGS